MDKKIVEKLNAAHQRIIARDKTTEPIILEALRDALAIGEMNIIADAYYHLANFHHTVLFDSKKAQEYIFIAKNYLSETTPLRLKLNIYSMMGTTFMALRDYISAQQYFMEALAMVAIPLNEETEVIRSIAMINYDFGIMYFNIGMYEFGYDFLKIATSLSQHIDAKIMIIPCKNAIASYYFHTKNFDKALEMFEEVRTEIGESEPVERLAVVYHYTGFIHYEKEDYKKAEEFYLKGLYVREQLGNEARNSFSYFGLAKLYFRIGRKEEGDKYFDLLKEVIAKHAYFFTEDKLNDMYWELYGERGDYELAYQYSRKIEMSVIEPKLVQKILKTVFEKEKEKQAQIFAQTEELKSMNQEMQDYAIQLELTNKDLSSFAHVTSHDLREPLRMISTYMTILEKKIKEKLTDNEKVFLKYVVEGTKRMDDMITRILKNARGDEGIFVPTSLDTVLQQVRSNLSQLIIEKKAEIFIEPLPILLGDEIQFVQVFQNLISNAIKYNESDVPQIWIDATKKDENYEIRVADNGVGIPESERKRAFEMFERVENSSGADGTGIGLSTVKSIVQKMKGNISIESNQPRGSIFCIEFPCIKN